MKRLLLVSVLFVCFQNLHSQGIFDGIFSKEKVRNLENFDKAQWSYGYYLGFNSYDFKTNYIALEGEPSNVAVGRNVGFNVGLVGNMRVNDYIDLRLEPGVLFTTRNLTFPGFATESDALREVKSTYVHIPLLVKFSTKRLNNFKPFVIGGVSTSINLSSNFNNPDDNSKGQFRMTRNTYYYEVGFGIDLYLYYFKFTPSIRGVFAINDELVRDANPHSPWTGNIDQMSSRAIFINFTFQ